VVVDAIIAWLDAGSPRSILRLRAGAGVEQNRTRSGGVLSFRESIPEAGRLNNEWESRTHRRLRNARLRDRPENSHIWCDIL
jgi:hypothetical protein